MEEAQRESVAEEIAQLQRLQREREEREERGEISQCFILNTLCSLHRRSWDMSRTRRSSQATGWESRAFADRDTFLTVSVGGRGLRGEEEKRGV
jgi:hypothetical protein